MGFKNNFAEAMQNTSIKPEGDYECIIIKAEERTAKTGTVGLNIRYVVRNDVDQGYKNGYIFDTLWKRKKPTEADMSVNGYGFGQIMALGKTANLPDGKDYDTLAQFLGELINKPVLVTLKHEEYNGKMQERVRFVTSTKHPDVKHVPKNKPSTEVGATYAKPTQQFAATQAIQQEFAEIDDDDLPF